MKPRSVFSRSVLYALLILASAVFAVPFAWLALSSFKPLDQAMAMPPTLFPRAYFAPIGGDRVEVTIDGLVRQGGVVADIVAGSDAGKRVFLPADQALARASELANAHRVGENGIRVIERQPSDRRAAPRWDIVPPEAVDSRVRFRWQNYPEALAALGGGENEGGVSFWRFLGNTLVVCVLGVIGTVLSNAIIAYGFARVKWRGRDAFFSLTLATLMVPFPVMMVPLYGVFRELGWIGTLLPLWVPAFFGSAFNIFLMRQFFLGIPEELSEAARIDGSSEWTIFWRIILPLSKPVLAASAVFHFLYAWNDFMGPYLYLTKKETFTLSLALQAYQAQNGGVQWHYLMAASTVTILPVIVLFFFAQRTFIQGIATTGSKS